MKKREIKCVVTSVKLWHPFLQLYDLISLRRATNQINVITNWEHTNRNYELREGY